VPTSLLLARRMPDWRMNLAQFISSQSNGQTCEACFTSRTSHVSQWRVFKNHHHFPISMSMIAKINSLSELSEPISEIIECFWKPRSVIPHTSLIMLVCVVTEKKRSAMCPPWGRHAWSSQRMNKCPLIVVSYYLLANCFYSQYGSKSNWSKDKIIVSCTV
jgi:hypothetical protein